MKTKTSTLVKTATALMAAAFFLAPQAKATVAGGPGGEVGYCSLQANMYIQSVHVVLGGSKGYGKGYITCNYADGLQENIPVIVRSIGGGVGLGVSAANATLVASGIGVMKDGYDLLGRYATVKGSVQALVVGAEASINLRATRNGITIPLELKLKAGPGVELAADVGKITIDLDTSRL